ncbi:MAG TPA: hypothetical protein VGP14_06405 [Casimicrobiaceae bacterium]|jgi:hypothetical protein|nr:hypothetical protein [Casimicrobiaceae bacterium]
MKPIVTSSLAALAAGLILGGCAVAPVDGPYAYGYARPYYYDNAPVYYETWPGYYPGYYYYGSPAIVGSFRFGGGDRHGSGGSWRHNSLNSGDQTMSRTQTTSRTFRASRAPTARTSTPSRSSTSTASRARTNRVLAHRGESDKS